MKHFLARALRHLRIKITEIYKKYKIPNLKKHK